MNPQHHQAAFRASSFRQTLTSDLPQWKGLGWSVWEVEAEREGRSSSNSEARTRTTWAGATAVPREASVLVRTFKAAAVRPGGTTSSHAVAHRARKHRAISKWGSFLRLEQPLLLHGLIIA